MVVGVAMLDDLRYSVRALVRTPAATLALIASAGIGIGANAVVFGFIGRLVDPAVVMSGDVTGVAARLETIGWLLTAVAMFVFAIATASVAGLLLSRGAARVHETSLRVALGAHGRDLLRPLIAEGVVVGVASIAFGMLAAFWMVHGLPSLFYAGDVEALPFVVDWSGLLLATTAGALVVGAGALAPLAWTSLRRPTPASRGTGPGLANTFGGWRAGVVVGQLMLCGVLLLSTDVVIEHLSAALRTDHAERSGNAVIVRVEPPERRFVPAAMLNYLDSVRDHFGVASTGLMEVLPGGTGIAVPFRIDAQPSSWQRVPASTHAFDPTTLRAGGMRVAAGRLFGGADRPDACAALVVNEAFTSAHLGSDALGRVLVSTNGSSAPIVGVVKDGESPRVWVYGPQGLRPEGYRAMDTWEVPSAATVRPVETLRANIVEGVEPDLVGLTLIAGRTFTPRDNLSACGVALVNEEAAAALGGATALGLGVVSPDGWRSEIVGIVRESPYRTLQPRVEPTVYFPLRQRVPTSSHIIVRAADGRSPEAIEQAIAAMTSVRGGRVVWVTTMQDHLSLTSTAADRLVTTVVQVFAVLALVLSLIGVTGVASDLVTRRSTEIALRLALGAPRWRIVAAIVTFCGRLALTGVSAGVLLCLVGFRFVAPLADGTRGPDLWVWAVVPLILGSLVIVGALMPARRAVSVDPAVLLRE